MYMNVKIASVAQRTAVKRSCIDLRENRERGREGGREREKVRERECVCVRERERERETERVREGV